MGFWQLRIVGIEGDANRCAVPCRLLKDRGDDATLSNHFPDPAAPFGIDVSELDAARAINCHSPRVGGIVRLKPELDGLSWLTHRNLEAARRATLVLIIGTDNGEGKLRQ
ncbi:hypothetical protein SPHV1_370004 [Novosphingobium sp. KN65.2]|nr:hypothetical protein SPHV1_370004 [Novosphingobium sp. KN65.2]